MSPDLSPWFRRRAVPPTTRQQLAERIEKAVRAGYQQGTSLDDTVRSITTRVLEETLPVLNERDRLAQGLARIFEKWFEKGHASLSFYKFAQGIGADLYDLRFNKKRPAETAEDERKENGLDG